MKRKSNIMYIALRDDSIDYRKNNNSQDGDSSEIKSTFIICQSDPSDQFLPS